VQTIGPCKAIMQIWDSKSSSNQMDDKKEMAKNAYSRKESDLFNGCRLFK